MVSPAAATCQFSSSLIRQIEDLAERTAHVGVVDRRDPSPPGFDAQACTRS